MNLREYERAKFELADILRSAWLNVDANPEIVRVSRDFFARLAEDRFNLVVVGRFNRGKSSLMNALLATTRLPVGVVPLTSVITTVSYGSEEQALIEYRNRHLPDRVPLDRLAEYVTERGNPGNARDVTTARVQLPSGLLLRGFHFIDTPGLGSSIVENTRTTEAFLPEADAVVLVTSYESPLSEEELQILVRVAASPRRVFLVVNKQDTVSTEERGEVLRHIRDQLSRILGADVQPFSVSARLALHANEIADRQRYAESGLPAFEEELTRFLVEQKQSEFLYRMCKRAADALDALGDAAPERERLRLLRVHIAPNQSSDIQMRLSPAISESSATASRPPRFSSCHVCTRIENALYTFLCRYQYDLIASQEARDRLADRGGLCELHTWQYEAIASPRGTCIGFSELLDRTAERLRDIAAAPACAPAITIDKLQPTPERCDLCAARFEAERTAIDEAASTLADREHESRAFPGLCVSHLRLLVASIDDSDAVRRLLLAQADVLERVSEDMQRYVMKFDGTRRFLASAEEEDAAHRALVLLAGDRQVNAARRPH
jgi:small GTP-binding protein